MGNHCPFLFMDLNIAKLIITVKPDSFAGLVRRLAGSGRSFEQALRNAVCTHPGLACDACDDEDRCGFSNTAGRRLSTDPELVRLHQRPGLPYQFSFPVDLHAESAFALTLLGPAIQQIPPIIEAIGALTETDPVVVALDISGARSSSSSLPDQAELTILSAADLLESANCQYHGAKGVLLEIWSPARLMHDGFEQGRFEPGLFVKALIRRVSALAAYYGTAGDAELFRGYAAAAEQVRLSSIRPISVPDHLARLRGVTGCCRLEGDFSHLGPLLELGSLFNLGKGAAYGQGCFRVSPR